MPTCPCGRGPSYDACCQPVHDGAQFAVTAEQLMRARYAAYARRRIEFLGESIHPKKRKGHDPESSRQWAEESTWLGLEVVSTEGGGAKEETGSVEFIARYESEGSELEHHEIAQFRKEDGLWYFWDGKTIGPDPVRREEPKIGRNDPCPCGSGKKYKKCCGR